MDDDPRRRPRLAEAEMADGWRARLKGSADTIIVIKRDSQGTTLYARGRDLEGEISDSVEFGRDTCCWKILGSADDVRQSEERRAIVDALTASDEAMTPTAIGAAIGKERRRQPPVPHAAADQPLVRRLSRGRYTVINKAVVEARENDYRRA